MPPAPSLRARQQRAPGRRVDCPAKKPTKAFECEIAGDEYTLEVLGNAGIVIECHARLAAALDQQRIAGEREFGDGRRRGHARI